MFSPHLCQGQEGERRSERQHAPPHHDVQICRPATEGEMLSHRGDHSHVSSLVPCVLAFSIRE